jgi:PAS domain S-box-containing protein
MNLPSETITVLHVDDDPDFVELTALFLEREDDRLAVETELCVADGLERLATEPVDCVVSDYDLPGSNGLEFLHAVREEYPVLPFILFTGKGSEQIASEAISAGITDYLQKGGGTSQYTILANRISNAVAESEARQFERLTNHSPLTILERIDDAFLALDNDWRITYLNERAEAVFETPLDELLGQSLWEQFDEATDTLFYDRYHEAKELNEPRTVEGHFEPWGRWYKEHIYPSENGLTVLFHDITEQKDRERRYGAIFNNTYQFTGLLEPDGTFIEVNEAGLAFGDVERADVIGKKMWNTYWFQLSTQTRERARDAVERAADGEFVRHELPVQGADSEAIVDFSVRPLTDDQGTVTQLIPEGRDITDLTEREQALKRERDRLDEFASVVAHDLRNPLNVAKGRIALARRTDDAEHLDAADAALERIDRITENVLRLARHGRDIGPLESVSIQSAVDSAWSLVADDADHAELYYRDDELALIEIEADYDRLCHLLENLLRNAIVHGGEAVTVTVETINGGFAIEDDGPGIPEKQREAMFSADRSTVDRERRFGLRIVERVADAHGWDIRVTDGADGGARFEITGVERSEC